LSAQSIDSTLMHLTTVTSIIDLATWLRLWFLHSTHIRRIS